MEQSQKQVPKAFRVAALAVIFFAYICIFVQTDKSLGIRFFMSGAGLMFSFLFFYILGGVFTGVSKTELNVPVKPALIIILVSVIHFLIGGYLGIET